MRIAAARRSAEHRAGGARMPPAPLATLLAVGAGGALGALLRHYAAVWLGAAPGAFPADTLAVNVAGATLLGFVVAVPATLLPPSSLARAFVGPGFCGGLTTFSTLSVQIALLGGAAGGQASWPVAVSYAALSLGAAVPAVLAGRWAARRVFFSRRAIAARRSLGARHEMPAFCLECCELGDEACRRLYGDACPTPVADFCR